MTCDVHLYIKHMTESHTTCICKVHIYFCNEVSYSIGLFLTLVGKYIWMWILAWQEIYNTLATQGVV